ncbi:hypothetical protein J6590_079425 [Homalodisca vitripennis]|nr:hypothetical protein J6590_079425 [Homalodisca vitripennis]
MKGSTSHISIKDKIQLLIFRERARKHILLGASELRHAQEFFTQNENRTRWTRIDAPDVYFITPANLREQ